MSNFSAYSSRGRLLRFLEENLTFSENPKFFTYLSAVVSNISDNASTLIAFDTVKSDATTSFNTSTSQLEVPKAGLYYFNTQCMLRNVPTDTAATGYLKFVHRNSSGTSLGNYVGQYYTFADFNSDSNFQYFSMMANAIIEASEGDTVEVQIGLSGVGADTVDIFGHSSNLGATGFRGFLIP